MTVGAKIYALSAVFSALAISGTAAAQDEITFQQVLQNPGDLELNIAFAQQRVRDGDLLAAAATLERILITEPNWDDARLLYASVLYQLGDFSAAKREADLLEGRDMSEAALVELEKYRTSATNKTKRTRISGRLSAGVGYDENAGGQIAEDGAINVVDQYSMVLRGRLKIEHDLSDVKELALFAEGDAYYKQFEDSEFPEFLIANARAGMTGETRLFDWRANGAARSISIGGDGYLTELGGELRLTRDITPMTSLRVRTSYFDQDYDNVFDGDNSDGRDGDRFDIGLTLRHSFSPKYRGSVGIAYRQKNVDDDALEAFFAYDFTEANAGFSVFWPKGNYLNTTLIYRDYEYEGSSTFQREDSFVYGRASYGVPLNRLFRETSADVLDKILLEGAISYTDRDSTVSTATTEAARNVFDFDNTGAELRLIYRF